jgi:DNA polymerase bacteriophage-type
MISMTSLTSEKRKRWSDQPVLKARGLCASQLPGRLHGDDTVTTLFLDLETYSEVPITYGTHRYAEKAEIMLAAWAVDDGPVVVCAANGGLAIHDVVVQCAAADRIVIHNSYFDRTILHYQGIDLPIEKIDDTMVMAMSHGLPGGLLKLCEILRVGIDKAKDKAGHKLIQLFCKPRPKTSKIRRATRETHPEEWAQFVDYARLDIEAMREIYRKLPRWNNERELWHLDQKINDRGVAIDMDLVEAALTAIGSEQEQLSADTQEQTFGVVASATQRDALLGFIKNMFGVEMPDLQGSTVERFIADEDLDPALRELLLTRLQASTASVAKYKALERAVSPDGRLRGALQFCGATRTGRWAGRLFQPQNLPRPWFPSEAIEAGIEALKDGEHDAVLHGSVMDLTSNALRGCIVAPKDKTLDVADLSNIEGRVLAWLAGEQWKLDAFAAFDRGEGPDLYNVAYGRSFNVDPATISKEQRQLGKVQELALGYEGGVGAFLTFVVTYRLDIEDMAPKAMKALAPDVVAEAADAWDWSKKTKRNTFGLDREVWIACDAIKRAWRLAHPAISSLWKEIERACRWAVERGGENYVGDLLIDKKGSWLRIRLPSGRFLCYPAARVDEQGKISYMGVNQYSRRFERISTYGGKLAENVTQAVARDVLAEGMLSAEAMGYAVCMSIHDELLTEAPIEKPIGTPPLAEIMASNPQWSTGLPLAAAGFTATRYRKD